MNRQVGPPSWADDDYDVADDDDDDNDNDDNDDDNDDDDNDDDDDGNRSGEREKWDPPAGRGLVRTWGLGRGHSNGSLQSLLSSSPPSSSSA